MLLAMDNTTLKLINEPGLMFAPGMIGKDVSDGPELIEKHAKM